MLKSLIGGGLASAALLAFVSLATPAMAAPIKAVLKACDNTPGCGYSINKKNGDISGCSTTTGKCFYCANDGKRECISLAKPAPDHSRQPAVRAPKVTVQLY